MTPEHTGIYKPIGELLRNYFKDNHMTKAEFARRLGVAPSAVIPYYNAETMQVKTLWNICLATRHNFLAEVSAQLPVDIVDIFKSDREKELEKRIERLEIELSVYKNILINKHD